MIPPLPDETIPAEQVSLQKVKTPQIRLQPGEQYYFVKSIEQKLAMEPGNPLGRVWERVELLLSLNVREKLEAGYLLDVTFHNVLYQSQQGSQHLRYDSRSQASVPPEVRPYQKMVGRGFSLHVDSSNRIIEVVGFDQFLRECFSGYPAELTRRLLLSRGALSSEPADQIQSAIVFLDESFFLLPFDELSTEQEAFPVGSQWSRTYAHSQPQRTEQTLEATLQHIFGEGEWAQVVVGGQLRQPGASPQEPRVMEGSITGSCSVSLVTGLPKTCRIQREITMGLTPESQSAAPLRKTIVTTLKRYHPPAASRK